MRLFDRLRADPKTPDFVREGLRRATIVVADNVAQYYWSGTEQEYWEVNVHFPNLAPPFPTMWIETVAPKEIRSTEHPPIPWSPEGPRSWAILRQAIDLSAFDPTPEDQQQGHERMDKMIEDQMRLIWPIVQKTLMLGGGDPKKGLDALDTEERHQMDYLLLMLRGSKLLEGADPAALASELMATSGIRWLMRDYLFVDNKDGILPYPFWTFQFYVGADGSFQRVSDSSWYTSGPLRNPGTERLLRNVPRQALEGVTSHLVALWHTSLLCVSFMHCKNVARSLVDPVQEWRARNPRKKGYAPVLAKYYILDIHPMKEVLRREGRSEEVGVPRALHICRGHFATYTPEKPLFGKYAGTVWRPMHLRGTGEVGAVEKDYRVHPPGGDK